MDDDDLMTAQAVHAATGIPVSTLHGWAVRRNAGETPAPGPPHLDLGYRSRRWLRSDVLAWLSASRKA